MVQIKTMKEREIHFPDVLDKYPLTIVENPSIDENDSFFVKKKEDAIKALTECPLPDFLLNRIEKPQ